MYQISNRYFLIPIICAVFVISDNKTNITSAVNESIQFDLTYISSFLTIASHKLSLTMRASRHGKGVSEEISPPADELSGEYLIPVNTSECAKSTDHEKKVSNVAARRTTDINFSDFSFSNISPPMFYLLELMPHIPPIAPATAPPAIRKSIDAETGAEYIIIPAPASTSTLHTPLTIPQSHPLTDADFAV